MPSNMRNLDGVRRTSATSRCRTSRSCAPVRSASRRSIDLRTFNSWSLSATCSPSVAYRGLTSLVHLERDDHDADDYVLDLALLGNGFRGVVDDRRKGHSIAEDDHVRGIGLLRLDVPSEL